MNKKLLLPLIVLVTTSLRPEVPAGGTTVQTVPESCNPSTPKPQARQLVDLVFRNNIASIKLALEQGTHSTNDVNWAFVAAACSANAEIMQLLIDHNNTHAQKYLDEYTTDIAQAIAHFRELSTIKTVLKNNGLCNLCYPCDGHRSKYYEQHPNYLEDDLEYALDDAILAAIYLGQTETARDLIAANQKIAEKSSHDFKPEDSKDLQFSDLEIFLHQLILGYIIADAQNDSPMKEVLSQAISKKSSVPLEKLIEAVLLDAMDDTLDDDDIDDEDDIIDEPVILKDITRTLCHEIMLLAYKSNQHDKLKYQFCKHNLTRLFLNIGLIDADTKTLITTSQDEEFKKFINNIIQEQLAASQKAKDDEGQIMLQA